MERNGRPVPEHREGLFMATGGGNEQNYGA